MAEKRALTIKRVQSIKPPTKGQVDYFDAALPSFALRVTANGAKSFVLLYRPKVGPDAGKLRRMTIGSDSALNSGWGLTAHTNTIQTPQAHFESGASELLKPRCYRTGLLHR